MVILCVLCQMLQILVLGGGVVLVFSQEILLGLIVVLLIIFVCVFGLIDQIVGGWCNSVQIWLGWMVLSIVIQDIEDCVDYMLLLRLVGDVVFDCIVIGVFGGEFLLVQVFNFMVKFGDIIVLIGGIGMGKISFLQMIVGVWLVYLGQISLGGCDIEEWLSEDCGCYIGYIFQDVEFLFVIIVENIVCLFGVDDQYIIEVVKVVGVYEMIFGLLDGYEILVGLGGVNLFVGQK